MTITPEHLKTLAASLNNLAGTLDQIAQDLGEQPAPSPALKKSIPKKKSAKKAPTKKTASKKKPAKAKPKKTAPKPTKMDVVLETIRRARKELSVAELKKRTGFGIRTINNAVYRLKKTKKIKSAKKGVYTKA